MTSIRSQHLFSRVVLVAALTCAIAAPSAVLAQGPYSLKDKWKVGGEGGWDYLLADASAHRLYLTHGPRVEVIDTATGKVIGSITGLKGTHGVALDPAGKLGYISDGAANSVVVFDRATLQTIAAIPAGTDPDGIAFEPVTKTVWAFNGRSKDVSVIDTEQRKVIATIPLPGKPEFPQADGKGTVFVNIEDKNEIVRLDAKTKAITATWPLTGCESPSGMAIDLTGRRLFSVCDGKKMAVTDANSGKILATPTIGDSPDAAGYDAAHELAFSSNGDGTLTIIDASNPSFNVLQTIKTQRGARTMAFDPGTGRVYLTAAEYGPAPTPTPGSPRTRPVPIPGSFSVLVVGR
jgi:YVTN family beta-propeller protein